MRLSLCSSETIELEKEIRSAKERGCDLVLLPVETVSTRIDSEASDGPFASRVSELAKAHGIAVLAAFSEHCTSGRFIAALMCDDQGHMRCCYRQTHLPDQLGADDPLVGIDHGQWLSQTRLNGTMVGILMGDDLLHPEAARSLAVAGTDLLLFLGDGRLGRNAVRSLLAARALENHLPAAFAGPGLALVADSNGDLHEDTFHDIETALTAADAGRTDRLTRRRPRLYNAIIQVGDDEDRLPL